MVGFTEAADQVSLRSSKATVRCSHLILATNLQPIQGLEKNFGEETTVVLASRPVSEVKTVWPEDKVIWTMEEKYDILYPLGNRLALELYQARRIKQKLARYYSGIPFEVEYRWGDSWAKTPDLLPIAGSLTKRVYAAVAMGDEGVVMGFMIGSKMHSAIEGGSDALLAMTSPNRFSQSNG
jgi:glycine/D-amino acid oxidase-like deaminating enzyme